MTRTTIDLDPSLLEALKHAAAHSRQSMSRLANRLLREGLRREIEERRDRPLRWNVSDSGPAPGFNPATRDYLDLLEDEPWG